MINHFFLFLPNSSPFPSAHRRGFKEKSFLFTGALWGFAVKDWHRGWWALRFWGESAQEWERGTCLCNGNEQKSNSVSECFMEANRTCALPEITSNPLKIKCYTLILILLPRLYLFTSLTTPKLNNDLVCTAWIHRGLQILVWEVMLHVRLHFVDFVIRSNPQRKQN